MTFQKGQSGNPKGRPSGVLHTHADTAEYILDTYKPSEIKAIASNPERLDELPSFRAMVLVQLANALNALDNNDNALERERLLDRTVGRPMQRIEQKISLSIETESALLEGRRRVAKSRGLSEITNVSVPDAIYTVILSADEKLQLKRAKAREYMAARKAKIGKSKEPSFNDRLPSVQPIVIVDAVKP